MHKNATKCNETLSKWCKNKHGASKIIDTFETYQPIPPANPFSKPSPPIFVATPASAVVAAGAAKAAATSHRWPASSTPSTAATGRKQKRTCEALGASSWPLPTTCLTIRPTVFEVCSAVFSDSGGVCVGMDIDDGFRHPCR
jgi:hypothetical protein